jgi:starch synthase
MNSLYCTSEAYPLIKTGGLGDVSGSLPAALRERGNDVRLVLPAYPDAVQRAGALTTVARLQVTGTPEPVEILKGRFPDSELVLYLIDSPAHFRRPGNPYVQPDGNDWPDNAARFATFTRAIVALALGEADQGWRPDLVHCNDWQTGLVPALLSQHDSRPATLFTIHNLSYQGLFPRETFTALELPADLWSIDGVEFHGKFSFLKGGIACSDWVTTVSPTYAQEIRTTEFGYGLEGLLQYRSANLTGILNGMDTDVWNPATDPLIAHHYDVHRLQRKALNKVALQEELGLPANAGAVLLGHVGRLVEQKGVDLILEALDSLLAQPVQAVILGDGDERLEAALRAATERYPQQVAAHIGYDERLAHRIEAGADCFIMPSRFEPCGLNQMYSLRYGTVPIVHSVGGLADTVVDLTPQSAHDYTATGFTFAADTPAALLEACERAIAYHQNARVDWWKLVITGMKQDFSWERSAEQYTALYHRVCQVPPEDDDSGSGTGDYSVVIPPVSVPGNIPPQQSMVR